MYNDKRIVKLWCGFGRVPNENSMRSMNYNMSSDKAMTCLWYTDNL